MSLKHGLLGLLNEFSMSGYDLDKTFKKSLYFFWQANTSQIYRELNTMEEMGWLTSETVLQNDKPNKRIYSITKNGKIELKNWVLNIDDSIDSAFRLKNSFLMKLFFAGEVDKEVAIKAIKAFKKKSQETLKSLVEAYEVIEACEDLVENRKDAEFWKLTALFGDEYCKSCISWSDRAIEILKNMD